MYGVDSYQAVADRRHMCSIRSSSRHPCCIQYLKCDPAAREATTARSGDDWCFSPTLCCTAGEPAAAVRLPPGQREWEAVDVVGLHHAIRRGVLHARQNLQPGLRREGVSAVLGESCPSYTLHCAVCCKVETQHSNQMAVCIADGTSTPAFLNIPALDRHGVRDGTADTEGCLLRPADLQGDRRRDVEQPGRAAPLHGRHQRGQAVRNPGQGDGRAARR